MHNEASDLNSILTRLLEIALDLGRCQEASRAAAVPPPAESENDGFDVARAGLVGIARRLQHEADAREAYFPGCVSHDPVWPILLDLYIQSAEQKKVAVSDACIASRAPPTTALRWIAELVERGLVLRTPDVDDRRRAYLNLSDEAFVNMSRYLASIAGIASVPSPARSPVPKRTQRPNRKRRG